MELIWVAVIGFVFLMALAMFIYSLPAERFKRKRVTPPPPVKEKDWEGISKRWEKNNALLVNEIESLKKERKTFLEQIEDGQKIIREQIEQLAREKAWREKEGQMVEKVKNTDHELKEELRKAQNILNEGHSVKLRLEIEVQENKITIARLKEEVRALTAKQLAMEKEAETNKKELRELRYTNTELKKQKDDIQWVAKTDYDLVMMRCRKLESEFSRLTRDQASQQSSGPAPVQSPAKAPEQVSQQPPENASQQVPEAAAEQPSEQPPVQSAASAADHVSEQSSERVPEQVPEQASEQVLEEAPAQPSENVPEKPPETLPKQQSEQKLEQSSEQTPKPAPEEDPEKKPES